MKKVILLFIVLFMFTGCADSGDLYTETEEQSDPFINGPNINENLKSKISELRLLWEEFDEGKRNDTDPTEDFHQSRFMKELKSFLGQRESLGIAISDLKQLLHQNDLEAIDKKQRIGDKEFNVRVIGYNVDFYVQAITDFIGMQNKWIFVQCWNEDEFYFSVLSDGDIQYVTDFIPFEMNGTLHILITGRSSLSYPWSPFLWAWHLEEDTFQPSNLFPGKPVETDEYVIDTLDNSRPDALKWCFYTNGSYLFVQKGTRYTGSDWDSLLSIDYAIDEENKVITFTSMDKLNGSHQQDAEESKIQLILEDGLFQIRVHLVTAASG